MHTQWRMSFLFQFLLSLHLCKEYQGGHYTFQKGTKFKAMASHVIDNVNGRPRSGSAEPCHSVELLQLQQPQQDITSNTETRN